MGRTELKETYPIFNRRYTYFQLKQENREPASDTLDRIILQSKVSNVDKISKDDLSVHIFVNALSDSKLKDKILELDRKDGNIAMERVLTVVRAYEANTLIATKNKPANTTEKTTS